MNNWDTSFYEQITGGKPYETAFSPSLGKRFKVGEHPACRPLVVKKIERKT